MKYLVALAFYLAALLTIAHAQQFMMMGVGTATGGTSGPNVCASLGNQLDWSDATGCNLVWAGH